MELTIINVDEALSNIVKIYRKEILAKRWVTKELKNDSITIELSNGQIFRFGWSKHLGYVMSYGQCPVNITDGLTKMEQSKLWQIFMDMTNDGQLKLLKEQAEALNSKIKELEKDA